MTRMNRILPIAGLMLMLPACGAIRDETERVKTSNKIQEVALYYLMFLDDKKAPPADENVFSAWVAAKQPEGAQALAKLYGAGYKVYWGVDIDKLPAGSASTVLIYPDDAATKGGQIGMADGTVLTMTAAEFNAAPKPPAK